MKEKEVIEFNWPNYTVLNECVTKYGSEKDNSQVVTDVQEAKKINGVLQPPKAVVPLSSGGSKMS